VDVEQCRDLDPLGAGHAALGADAPRPVAEMGADEPHVLLGRSLGLVLGVVGDEGEAELGVGGYVE